MKKYKLVKTANFVYFGITHEKLILSSIEVSIFSAQYKILKICKLYSISSFIFYNISQAIGPFGSRNLFVSFMRVERTNET